MSSRLKLKKLVLLLNLETLRSGPITRDFLWLAEDFWSFVDIFDYLHHFHQRVIYYLHRRLVDGNAY